MHNRNDIEKKKRDREKDIGYRCMYEISRPSNTDKIDRGIIIRTYNVQLVFQILTMVPALWFSAQWLCLVINGLLSSLLVSSEPCKDIYHITKIAPRRTWTIGDTILMYG